MKPLFSKIFIAAVLVTAATCVRAETISYEGTTIGANTFNRPSTLYTLSSVGTNVEYHAFKFNASASGAYTFLTSYSNFDGFALLYTDFDPASPLSNLLNYNDDYIDLRHSSFDAYLQQGTDYTYVNTGYSNRDYGNFTAIISSASISTVPEPETYAMLLAGLGLMGFAARRRRQA